MFTVGGDDIGAFFPVHVSFVGKGSLAGVVVSRVTKADGGEEHFSVDSLAAVDQYDVV